jgi:hypothetical protein
VVAEFNLSRNLKQQVIFKMTFFGRLTRSMR